MRRIFYLVDRELKRLVEVGPLKSFVWIIWLLVITYPRWTREFTLFFKLRKQGNFLIKEIQGSKLYLDMRDKGLSRELAFEAIREPVSTKTLHSEVKEGDVIVDIGANIGFYALMEAKLVGPKGKVYAIEPVPHIMEILKYNIELNEYSNIETFPFAIGEENHRASMYTYKDWNHSSLISPDSTRGLAMADKIDVDVVTLDEFLKDKRFPNLIRMDVEGFEYYIIRGMKNILESGSPLKLFIELHPVPTMRALLVTLKKFGFEATKVIYDEPSPLLMNPLIVRKAVEFLNRKRLNQNINFGYLNMTLDDVLNNKFIMDSKFEWLHILFERP